MTDPARLYANQMNRSYRTGDSDTFFESSLEHFVNNSESAPPWIGMSPGRSQLRQDPFPSALQICAACTQYKTNLNIDFELERQQVFGHPLQPDLYFAM